MNNHREDDLKRRLSETWCGHSGMSERHLVNPDGPDAIAHFEALTAKIAGLEGEVGALRHAATLALDFALHRQGNDAAETVVVADLRAALSPKDGMAE